VSVIGSNPVPDGETATGAAVDVTALRAHEAHALAILDAALDAVITIDHRGNVLEYNRAAEEAFGYRRADVLGRELVELIVPHDLRDSYRRTLAGWTEGSETEDGGPPFGRRMDVEALRADGTVFPAELAISRVEIPGPAVFTACIRDVSDRRDAEQRLVAAEQRYRLLVEQLPLISYVDRSDDPIAKPLYISPQVEAVLGHSPEEWLSVPGLYERCVHEDDRAWVLAAKKAAYERGEPSRLEYRMRTAAGRVVWVEDQSVLVGIDTDQGFRQGFAVDITERKEAELALRRAETRYRTLVEQLPLAVYIDRMDDESSNIYTSPQIEPMLGYTTEEWAGDPSLFVATLHPDDREPVLAAHAATHATCEPLHLDYRLIARDGRVVWVHDEARVITDDEGEQVLQGYLLDITDQRQAEELLRHQAFHDPLTGLANRALFTDRVQHALVRRRVGGEAAVLFLDLDDFKAVNDTLGHVAGDSLLRAVAARLDGASAPSHTVARLGGDEFAILIEEVKVAAAVDAAERVIAALQAPFDLEGREVFVTASVGIAVGDDADELLRSADVAMYRAKGSGKAQYVVYAPRMEEDIVGRLELVADLRRVRVDQDLVLHYQPTVDLATGAIVGVEGLVRWQHPTRGLLPPSDFIPLAEETGRIVEIGRWVLTEACRRAAGWRKALPAASGLAVSVNVSTRQIRRPGLVDDVRAALDQSGLEPSALTLEITESMLARRREEMASILDEVTGLGVRLALDDFGTGYSSLSLLQDLPVHTLKIDRSFVQSIDTGPQRAAFVRAIVELADALSLGVVAEGVESAAHVLALRGLGCRLGQGFHFAAPLDADGVERALVRCDDARAREEARSAVAVRGGGDHRTEAA
jgi:diguanylate cyclase (GGDEF)-like protein/PAS domain S-box-containing protein